MRGRIITIFLVLLLSIVGVSTSGAQPTGAAPSPTTMEVPQVQMAGIPLAGAVDNLLIVYDGMGNPTIIDLPGMVRGYALDATGDQVAILASSDDGLQLWLSNLTDGRTYRLDTGALENFTPAFDEDGFVLYVEQGENRVLDPANPYSARLMRIEPQNWATPEEIGAFELTLECDGGGGGAGFEADALYQSEAGFLGNQMLLRVTPYGILHSRTCGGLGYAFFNRETGEDMPIPGGESLIRGTFSPDGDSFYAIQWSFDPPQHQHTLVQVDLETLTLYEITTSQMPDQLAVAPDGTVIYSSREARDDGGYTTSIFKLNPETLEETPLLTSEEWFGVARLVAPENNYILFSAIPNIGVEEPAAGVYLMNTEIEEPLQPVVLGLRLFSLLPVA